ncbi:MAG: Gfo/Idh/MocA family oxidoreductase [Planctomycetaceae bacterium]|jgi:predicted dehydrogenase|nr:Gfo/Idh/MocA family oxidoreductase [Planctomycetaceae bacterium]
MKRQKSRRTFLKQTGAIAAAGAVLASGVIPKVHAASSDTIKLAIVGCGNRGKGAAFQALSADPNLKFWATADVFADKAKLAADDFKREKGDMVDISPDRIFNGFDGYKKAMDALDPGDVVLLTTPPAFRPLHYAYAVEKGLNVFAEKPLAVDIPGLKSLQESNKKAKEKGLKIGVGLNNRHLFRTEETIEALHAGKLGELFSFLVYRCENAHGIAQQGNQTPLQHQLRRIFNFNWLTGSFIVDALIHNLDICCWANHDQLPVSALGIGGRLFRNAGDDLIDNANVQYTFADGKKMHMYTVTIPNTWHGFRAIIHGAKGSCMLGEGVGDPKFYKDWNQQEAFWEPKAPGNDTYQTEHDRFFKAIRDGVAWNELDRGIDATFTAILGRMAIETGNMVTAEQAWTSTYQYAPDIDKLTLSGDSPVMPDANGNYRIAHPGKSTINNPYQD